MNGNYTIMHRKVIIHPGITIEYSGPDTVEERLNTSRTINIDVILEVMTPHISKYSIASYFSCMLCFLDFLGTICRKDPATNYIRVHCAKEYPKELQLEPQRLVRMQLCMSRYEVS